MRRFRVHLLFPQFDSNLPEAMLARRYTVILADRSSGAMRRVTISLRPALALIALVVSAPVLIGLGAKWSARADIDRLRTANGVLEVENGSYRAATGELTAQIQSLEDVINELGTRAAVDPVQARAMQRLPAVVRSRAVGGSALPPTAMSTLANAPISSPEDTFGVLRELLQGLENRLRYVRRDVERREELAAATPSIWPAHGWLTGTFGGRSDPFTGEPGYHQGIDISTEKGNPVYAGPTRQTRRRDRLRGIDGSFHRRAPALRDPRERPSDEPAAAAHSTRQTVNLMQRDPFGAAFRGALRHRRSPVRRKRAAAKAHATICGYLGQEYPRCRCSIPFSPKSSAPKTNGN